MMEENLEKYKSIRTQCTSFVNEKLIKYIIDKYRTELFIGSAKKLGMLQGNKTIVHDTEDDIQYLFDFLLCEAKIDGRNALDIYKREVGLKDAFEKKVITAFERSYTSLYRVINTSPSKGLIFLKDILNGGKNIRLTDLGISKLQNQDVLIFTRVITIDDINMTSGMSCVYAARIEKRLMQRYSQIKQISNPENESMNRFLFFYEDYKNIGIEKVMQKV